MAVSSIFIEHIQWIGVRFKEQIDKHAIYVVRASSDDNDDNTTVADDVVTKDLSLLHFEHVSQFSPHILFTTHISFFKALN